MCPQAYRPVLGWTFCPQSVMKIIFKNSLCLGTVSFQSFMHSDVWGRIMGVSHCKGPQSHDLKTCTARTTYCRQMGHSLMRLPHLVQVTMCPHSSRTQSMTASMQIRHRLSSSSSWSCIRSPSEKKERARALEVATGLAPLPTAKQPSSEQRPQDQYHPSAIQKVVP